MRLIDQGSPRDAEINMPASMKYDVIGRPRQEPVHIPDYLTKSSRKTGFPNEHVSLWTMRSSKLRPVHSIDAFKLT